MNYRTKVARKQAVRSKHAKQQLKRKKLVKEPYSVKIKQSTVRRLSNKLPTDILTNYSRLEDEYSKNKLQIAE